MSEPADTPEPPYYAVIFTSARTPGESEAYAQTAGEMTRLAARQPVAIDDGAVIDTSFPGFVQSMNGLGAAIAPTGDAG